nr:unnamed protein product [Digitaria exilis]
MESSRLLDAGNGSPEPRWCAVTGGRGFMARHLVAALLRSGEWRVRVTGLDRDIVLGLDETEELLGDALRDGRAIYAQADNHLGASPERVGREKEMSVTQREETWRGKMG